MHVKFMIGREMRDGLSIWSKKTVRFVDTTLDLVCIRCDAEEGKTVKEMRMVIGCYFGFDGGSMVEEDTIHWAD